MLSGCLAVVDEAIPHHTTPHHIYLNRLSACIYTFDVRDDIFGRVNFIWQIRHGVWLGLSDVHACSQPTHNTLAQIYINCTQLKKKKIGKCILAIAASNSGDTLCGEWFCHNVQPFLHNFFFFLDFVQPYHSNFNSSDITHHMNILSSIYKYICIYGALDMRRPMTNLTRLALCSLIEPELKIPREWNNHAGALSTTTLFRLNFFSKRGRIMNTANCDDTAACIYV